MSRAAAPWCWPVITHRISTRCSWVSPVNAKCISWRSPNCGSSSPSGGSIERPGGVPRAQRRSRSRGGAPRTGASRPTGRRGHIPRGTTSTGGHAWPTPGGGGLALPPAGRDHDPRGAARHQPRRARTGGRPFRGSPSASDLRFPSWRPVLRRSNGTANSQPVCRPHCRRFWTGQGRRACRPTAGWARESGADLCVRIGRVLLGSGARPPAGARGRRERARAHPYLGSAHPQSFCDRLAGAARDRGGR